MIIEKEFNIMFEVLKKDMVDSNGETPPGYRREMEKAFYGGWLVASSYTIRNDPALTAKIIEELMTYRNQIENESHPKNN